MSTAERQPRARGSLRSRLLVVALVGLACALFFALLRLRLDSGRASAGDGVAPSSKATGEVGQETAALVDPGQVGTGRSEPSIGAETLRTDEATFVLFRPDRSMETFARVVVCQDKNVLWKGQSDEAGTVRLGTVPLEGAAGTATLIVLPRESAPQAIEVALRPGRHEVQLATGAVVSGAIRMSGRAPEGSLALQLRSNHPLLWIEQFGPSWKELGLDPAFAFRVPGETRPDGTFHFHGLPADFGGYLQLPRHLRPKDALLAGPLPNSVRIARPQQDLVMELVTLLRLTGRIVETPGGRPVPGALVQPALEHPDDEPRGGWQDGARADGDGRFQLVLANPVILGGSLRIASPGERLIRSIEIEPLTLSRDHDLGELALVDADGALTLRLLILDTDGAPVAGAVAGIDDDSPASAPSDETGRTLLRGVIAGVSTVEVYALGFERAEASLPADPPDELVVTLQRSTVLELQLRSPRDGDAVRGRVILGAAEPPLTAPAPPRSVRAYMNSGNSIHLPQHLDDDAFAVRMPTDRRGLAVVSGVKPGIPLWVSVLDRLGTHVVQRMPIAPLLPEERRSVDVLLPRAAAEFAGLVMDDVGRPLSDAQVKISFKDPGDVHGSGSAIGQSTDFEGRFVIAGVFGEHLDLSIQAFGFVPFHDARCEVPTDGSVREFRLRPGRDVVVTIERQDGGRLDGRVLATWEEGSFVLADRIGQDEYVLHGMPAGIVTIRASVLQTSYTREVGPAEQSARILVPPLGRVEAMIALLNDPRHESAAYYLALIPAPDSGLSERWEPLDLESDVWPVFASVENVLPGRYGAVLKREYGDGWSQPVYVDASTPISIDVGADEVTAVRIAH